MERHIKADGVPQMLSGALPPEGFNPKMRRIEEG
jgi:hypothetical protein